MAILCKLSSIYENIVIISLLISLESNIKAFFLGQQWDRWQKANSAGKGSLRRVHKPTNYDKYKGMMDYGKGNAFKFLHQTNSDLDRVLQRIPLKEDLYTNVTFWILVANCTHPLLYTSERIWTHATGINWYSWSSWKSEMKTGNLPNMKAKAKVIWCSTHFFLCMVTRG
jgi:hypothetical protein